VESQLGTVAQHRHTFSSAIDARIAPVNAMCHSEPVLLGTAPEAHAQFCSPGAAHELKHGVHGATTFAMIMPVF